MRLAERDIELAKNIRKRDLDWCFSIAYNAMLQAGRALMFSAGYRPSAESHHSAVVKFSAAYLGKENEADFAITSSRKFIDEVKRKISKLLE